MHKYSVREKIHSAFFPQYIFQLPFILYYTTSKYMFQVRRKNNNIEQFIQLIIIGLVLSKRRGQCILGDEWGTAANTIEQSMGYRHRNWRTGQHDIPLLRSDPSNEDARLKATKKKSLYYTLKYGVKIQKQNWKSTVHDIRITLEWTTTTKKHQQSFDIWSDFFSAVCAIHLSCSGLSETGNENRV